MEKEETQKLSYPKPDSVISKELALFSFVEFDKSITEKKIDDNLSLLADGDENDAIEFCEKYLSLKPSGAYFLYKFDTPEKRKHFFEATDNFRDFALAISLLKNKTCPVSIHFSYNDQTSPTEYYKPFEFFDLTNDIFPTSDDQIFIDPKEFEKLKDLYARILKIQLHRGDVFCRLKNAIEFFIHGNNEKWFVMRIALYFVALESLFSDDKNEISYKISLRTAYFLFPDNPKERKQLFDQLRAGYTIRSNFIHGSKIDTSKWAAKLNFKNNPSYILWIDYPNELKSIISDVILKIISDPELIDIFSDTTDKKMKDFFDLLVLGK